LVKVNDKLLKASCTEPATEGMKIITEDQEIKEIRKGILEMLMAEGEYNWEEDSELKKLAEKYDCLSVDSIFPKNVRDKDFISSKGLKRDENKCILCGRCVKACSEIQMMNVWGFSARGSKNRLTADMFEKIGDSTCVACGTCVQLCPTGALSFQTVLGEGKDSELEKESSICIYCGVGCKIDFYKNKKGELVKALGCDDGPNEGHLCVKGRFGFDFVQSEKRLSAPLIRKNGQLEEATWDEALDLVASKLGEIKKTSGPDSIMSFSSAKCTNEENYIFQKFMRAVIGTNNVDHCARL
jgi:predicted molibdopterin-dependent oxidoreductase YjgC